MDALRTVLHVTSSSYGICVRGAGIDTLTSPSNNEAEFLEFTTSF
jgi:hypothetical protein